MYHFTYLVTLQKLNKADDMQEIRAAAARDNVQLTFLSASNMRQALRSKGNIVNPSEISTVLSYVISDENFEDLHDLHLILLGDNTVKQIKWKSPKSSRYFVFTDAKSRSIFDLMAANKHQLVEHAPAWAAMSKYVILLQSLLRAAHAASEYACQHISFCMVSVNLASLDISKICWLRHGHPSCTIMLLKASA